MHAGLGKLGAVLNRAFRVGLSGEQNLKGMRALATEMPGLAECLVSCREALKPVRELCVSQGSGRWPEAETERLVCLGLLGRCP